MNSQKTEKKPPISHMKLFLLFMISGIILNFIIGIFLDTFGSVGITFIVLLPIYAYLSFKYFHKPLVRRARSKKREGTQCPHHSNEKISTRCNTCNSPICARCQNFKSEMRNSYQHNFRINYKLFDQFVCMDCIFEKLNFVNKFLFISGPIGFVVGVLFILAGFYIEFLPFNLFLIGGIVISILGLALFILAFIFNRENNKVYANFHQYGYS